MKINERLILECKAWTKEKKLSNKNYFNSITGKRNTNILWIGSSDSLISVREITNTEPGEILLYQNMASQVKKDDLSFIALLEDALESHQIELIIVCGYGKCSGIKDVLDGVHNRKPSVKLWLDELTALYAEHKSELDKLPYEQREDKLSELNIKKQVLNLSEMDIIRNSWEQRSAPILLGWYLDMPSGDMKQVFRMDPQLQPEEIVSAEDRRF